MDTCVCCSKHPTASIPANIFNRAFEDSGWSQPSNWQPQVMSAYVANFASDFKFNASVDMNAAMGNQGAQPQMGQPGMPQVNINMNTGQMGQPQMGQPQMGQPGMGGGINVNMQMGGQMGGNNNNGYQPVGGSDYPEG